MGAFIDLVGRTYNRLTVVKRAGFTNQGGSRWECLCDCGNTTFVSGGNLRNGHTRSCGCLLKEFGASTAKDIAGQRFGRLVAIEPTEKRRGSFVIWRCVCDCGNEKMVPIADLTRSATQSCGCLRREVTSKRASEQVGSKGPSYNPNLTDEHRERKRLMRSRAVPKWRVSVFRRDNYTCQLCGARCGNGKRITLNAHHLDGWNWAADKRTDVNNGVTLCLVCHTGFHEIYGNGDNTRAQFEEYCHTKLGGDE